jgi:Methyltransferase domain
VIDCRAQCTASRRQAPQCRTQTNFDPLGSYLSLRDRSNTPHPGLSSISLASGGHVANVMRPIDQYASILEMNQTTLRSISFARSALLRVGRHASPGQLDSLRSILSYLELGSWLESERSESSPEPVTNSFALFELARRRLTGQMPLYLEFGVFEGVSMRWWSRHLSQPGATLVGFDSFEGLPEDWRHDTKVGHFRTSGPPHIHDSRVSFQVGWFDNTLRQFAIPDHDQLIINIDCDLYSSALTVLRWASPYLRPGTLIYFDEFGDRDHERRAFNEWRAQSAYEFKPLGFANGGLSWLFEVAQS